MRETVTSVQDKGRASLPGGDAAHAGAGGFALPRGFPGQPGGQEGHGVSESPEDVLTTVVGDLSRQLACHAGREFPARAGAGLPGLAAAVAACGGRDADGRGAAGADRGRLATGSAGRAPCGRRSRARGSLPRTRMRRRRRRGRGRRCDQARGSPRGWRGGPNDVTSPDPSESAQGCAARHVTGCSVPLNRHATTICKRYRVGREAASGLGQALGPPPPTRLPIANVHADRRISMCKSNVRSSARVRVPDRTAERFNQVLLPQSTDSRKILFSNPPRRLRLSSARARS